MADITMERFLKRYVVVGPENLSIATDKVRVLSKRASIGESEWIIWGEENDALGAFEGAGGKARAVRSVSLAEAARVLISTSEGVQ